MSPDQVSMPTISQELLGPETVIKKAIIEVVPKFDEMLSIDVLYNEGGKWHTIEVSWREYLAMLQNGIVEDTPFALKNIVAICVNERTIELEDGSTELVRVIYDFVLKHNEKDPWRLA